MDGLVKYKDIKKEIRKLLDDKENNIDELDKISLLLRKQKVFLDSKTIEDLNKKFNKLPSTDERRDLIYTMISEKKVYESNEDEINNIINGDYSNISSKRTIKKFVFIPTGIAVGSLVFIGGLTYIMNYLGKHDGNNNKEESGTSISTEDSTYTEEPTTVAEISTTVKTENNTSKKEESTEKVEYKIITEDDLNEESKDDKKTESSSKADKKHNESSGTKPVNTQDNKDNNKSSDSKTDQTKPVDDKKKDDNKSSDNKKNDDKKTDDKKKDDKKTDDKKTDNKKTDEKYQDIEPSTVVIDNTNDDKSDIVTDIPSTDPLPSTDHVDDEPVNDNKGENNDNTVLPPVNDDTVIGDDEGIEYDITGSVKSNKKLTLSRGRL